MPRQRNRRRFRGIIWPALLAALLPAVALARGQVRIGLVDAKGKTVKVSSSGVLELARTYEEGDRVVVTGARYLAVKVDEHFAEAILYAPGGKVVYPIPLWQEGKYANRYPHPPKAFQGAKHVIRARAATGREIGSYRNVALNPMDPRGESVMYPHASSESEWGEAGIFAARTAIDGFVEATGDHHSWPRQAWGPYLPGGRHPAPELKIDFGRPVRIDKLAVVVRHNVRQNNHWKEATVEFSDGSKVKINPEFNGERQEFPIKERTVSSMRFVDLVPDKPRKYAAFVEVEAWGRDSLK